MKIRLLVLESKAPDWVSAARQDYVAKLKPFFPFELISLKSPSAERDAAAVKKKREAEILLKQIGEKDLLVLFDESGKIFSNSEDLAKHLSRHLESGKAQLIFCIGGPYGFDDSVVKRSNAKWSLSPLTMNHWIAQITALEQLYRGMTILKRIPYHNR